MTIYAQELVVVSYVVLGAIASFAAEKATEAIVKPLLKHSHNSKENILKMADTVRLSYIVGSMLVSFALAIKF